MLKYKQYVTMNIKIRKNHFQVNIKTNLNSISEMLSDNHMQSIQFS